MRWFLKKDGSVASGSKYTKIQNTWMPVKCLTLGCFSVSETDQIGLMSTVISLDQDAQQILLFDYVLSFKRVINI